MAPPTSLSADQKAKLQQTLDDLVKTLPCAYLTLVSPTETLFDGWSGKFDVLDPNSRGVSGEDVVCFYSTTKLITSVVYLTLVDKVVLSLDTDMTALYPPLKEASKQILTGFDEQGQPKLTPNDKPITLLQMLNQSSGFGMEFGETVQAWKKVTPKGKGYVNSCKTENLIHTPICYEPGTVYEYGNSAEWLALILPTIVGKEAEAYYQESVLKPLGMDSTTFYPFANDELKPKLMPLRFGRGAEGVEGATGPFKGLGPTPGEKTDGIKWEELNGQLDLLNLPRKREEIEFPAGGGGIYSKTSDYARLLQYLLQHYLSLTDSSVPPPAKKVLSDESAKSIFHGTLTKSAQNGIAKMFGWYLSLGEDHPGFKDGEADWSTAIAIYQPFNEYWMDPKSGIAAVFTTQMLPGKCPPVANAKKAIEKAIYDVIG